MLSRRHRPTHKRLAITGAAGYIGNLVARTARDEGWTVLGVDDLSGPVSLPPPDIEFLKADFSSPGALRRMEDADVVLHLGAVSGVVACARDPLGTWAVNVAGTGRLVAMCRRRRIPLAFSSSLAVVGAPDRMPIVEETPPGPTHEYARQKTEGEWLVRKLRATGVPATIARMSNVYGSYRVGDREVAKGNVVNAFVRQAASGTLHVNAPGTQRRDFVHIDDVVRAWLRIADQLSEGSSPESPYIVARGRTYSVLDVASRVASEWVRTHSLRPPLQVEVVENPRADIELLDSRFEVDPSRTWASLGISPRHDLASDLTPLLALSPLDAAPPARRGARLAHPPTPF